LVTDLLIFEKEIERQALIRTDSRKLIFKLISRVRGDLAQSSRFRFLLSYVGWRATRRHAVAACLNAASK
jgi:hypothetical protein